MTNEYNNFNHEAPTVDEIRQLTVGRFVRQELREAVLDGLLEIAKPHPDVSTSVCINRSIVARLEGLFEEREVLGGEWAEVLLAGTDEQTHKHLFGSEEAGRATSDELANALEEVIAQYVNG